VTPIGGPRAGGTLIEIVGKNFGNSADGIVVFIGTKECTSLGMTQTGSLSCITPPGDGAGVTVSVVIGDYDRILVAGPFGGHQRDTAATSPSPIRSRRARWERRRSRLAFPSEVSRISTRRTG
jgi:hypothetical protein